LESYFAKLQQGFD
jgi:hypothetical protein